MIANEATLSRRAFLSTTGALVVALVAPAEFADAATPPPVPQDKLSSYISIDPDGSVVAYYGKIDGGQGLGTSIAQMVAEELDVPLERVHLVPAQPRRAPAQVRRNGPQVTDEVGRLDQRPGFQ